MDNNPDFIKIAEAYGIDAIRVTSTDRIQSAIQVAFKSDGPFLVHWIIQGNENVFPIIPPGKQNHEMMYPWED
jgi:acetolactate synthase I/II/III large subunit